jgi:hypothetical protein
MLHNNAAGCGSSAFVGHHPCRSKKQYYIKPDITHQLLQTGFLKARIIIQIVTNQNVKSQNITK